MAATAPRNIARSPARRRRTVQSKAGAKSVAVAKTASKVKEGAAPKAEPLSFRMDVQTRDLIDRAAKVSGQNRTDFMLSALRERATEVLLNQTLFTLNESDWDAFVRVLDDPPPPNAKLKALLSKASMWDQ